MKLQVKTRTTEKKSVANEMRRAGNIPAVLYSKTSKNITLEVNGDEFRAHMRHIQKGSLSNTVFTLTDESGKTFKAIVKEIQYHITSYRIQHLDLVELFDDQLVSLNIPIHFQGSADCAGVKLGGVVRQVIRKVKIQCLPKHIPSHFDIHVGELELGQSKRLSSISLPGNVKTLMNLNEVAVVIAKR